MWMKCLSSCNILQHDLETCNYGTNITTVSALIVCDSAEWRFIVSLIVSVSLVCVCFTVNPSTCSSTGSERLAHFFNKKVTTLQAGSPCNDFKGYCDVFMKCRLVDADGPLARLKKAIFNPELYENIAEWIVVSVPSRR